MYNDVVKLMPIPQETKVAKPSETVSVQTQSQLPKMPEPEKELFSWKAPLRPSIRKDKNFWVKVFVITTIFGFIIYIAEGILPVILLISLIFLFYVLTNVQLEEVVYKITNRGIRIADRLNKWDFFTHFWFIERGKTSILALGTFSVPGRLELIIEEKDKDKIRKILSRYIPEEEINPNTIDKASEWLSKKFF